MQALLLPLGDDWYALELDGVREVVPAPPITRIPRVSRAVLGVFNLRGDIVPVVDTAALLGLASASAAAHVAVIETSTGPAGLAVDALPVRLTLGDSAGGSDLGPGIGRFAIPGGGVATLLDPEALLGALEAG